MIESVAGREDCVAIFEEGQADEVIATDRDCGFALMRDADDAALAVRLAATERLPSTSKAIP